MIDTVDFQLPDPRLARAVRRLADDTFMSSVEDLAPEMLPRIPGYRPHPVSNCCLRMRCVEPHRDDWQDTATKRPRHYRALFWLFDGCLYLQVANDYAILSPGYWAFFDDRLAHSVVSRAKWVGLAVQYVRERRR
jgi:hypothetical protein